MKKKRLLNCRAFWWFSLPCLRGPVICVVRVQFDDVGKANTDLVLRTVVGCFHVWQFPEGSEICLCFAPSELMALKVVPTSARGQGQQTLKSLEEKISPVAQYCPAAAQQTAACQASLSITNSRSLLKLQGHRVCDAMQTISSSVIPFCPQSFPASGSFPDESALPTR